jgi:hypothetical protein
VFWKNRLQAMRYGVAEIVVHQQLQAASFRSNVSASRTSAVETL